MSPSSNLEAHLEQQRLRIDRRLDQLLPPETACPPLIHQAMRYSLFAGGKRLRPILCLEAGGLFSPPSTPDLEAVSCSLELVHTYSLIHDDLPALDNDDYRRGKLTCHKVFGDAVAILAGDALLTLAFRILSTLQHTPPAIRTALIAELSLAAGTVDGMIGGQVADLQATNGAVSAGTVEYIHRSKTGALIRASVCLGGIAGDAAPQDLQRLHDFGTSAGLAFQVADDILDVESSSEVLGKTAGKDAAQKKITYPAVFGMEQSRKIAAECVQRAQSALTAFGPRAATLQDLAGYLVSRKA
jgi:geranylgeranyl diphosphate synthase type II